MIFPFRVSKNGSSDGYWEFPYTLVQDFTLFVLMKEKNIDIWKRKLDWIAEKGGMALVNVHPDYINFNNESNLEEFSVNLYIELLKYITDKYNNQYWNPLPKDLVKYLESQSLILHHKTSKGAVVE